MDDVINRGNLIEWKKGKRKKESMKKDKNYIIKSTRFNFTNTFRDQSCTSQPVPDPGIPAGTSGAS